MNNSIARSKKYSAVASKINVGFLLWWKFSLFCLTFYFTKGPLPKGNARFLVVKGRRAIFSARRGQFEETLSRKKGLRPPHAFAILTWKFGP